MSGNIQDSTHRKREPMKSIADTIKDVIRRGLTTAVELADVAVISDSAVNRYQTEETEPKFATVQAWASKHPHPEVRRAFVETFIESTGYQAIPVPDLASVTPEAAMKALHTSMERLASGTNKSYQAIRDGDVSAAELAGIDEDAAAVVASVQTARGVFTRLHQEHHRKPARRVP